MRSAELRVVAPLTGTPKPGVAWWLAVAPAATVAVPAFWLVGAFTTLSLNVPETEAWEAPAILFAGLAAGAVAGLIGRVRGWWLAGVALSGVAAGGLTRSQERNDWGRNQA